MQRLKRTLGKSKEKTKVKEEKPEDWTVVTSEKSTSEDPDSELLAPMSRTSTGILYASTGLVCLPPHLATRLRCRPRQFGGVKFDLADRPQFSHSPSFTGINQLGAVDSSLSRSVLRQFFRRRPSRITSTSTRAVAS